MQRVHFIAIGGVAMHSLALALSNKKHYEITGSDDEIFEPSYSRLKNKGLLPEKMGWFPERIHNNLTAVIVGMHAREDNPELIKAKKIGLKIFSFPEYLYQQSRSKTRIVVGGSHGKTTIVAMILHVLKKNNIKTDYMVGAQIDGFENMVSISYEARVAVFEGDEYLTSPVDKRPKFHLYKPHIGVLTGIDWGNINVFPTYENYVEQFKKFVELMELQSRLIYFEGDLSLQNIVKNTENARRDIVIFNYTTPKYQNKNGITYLKTRKGEIALKIFGEHNLQNLEAARIACKQVGVQEDAFYLAISDFSGVTNRLEKIAETPLSTAYKDFAHAPSMVKATVEAVKKQFPDRKLIACLELHTESSLTPEFLPQFNATLQKADIAMIYYNPEMIKHTYINCFTPEKVSEEFGDQNIIIYTDINKMVETLRTINMDHSTLLFMSSGDFSGTKVSELAYKLLNKQFS